jgi:hypothetical protein
MNTIGNHVNAMRDRFIAPALSQRSTLIVIRQQLPAVRPPLLR